MTPEPKIIGHKVQFGNTLIGLFKRGWWEIPEIMGSTGLALVGIGLGIMGMYNYVKNDCENTEFKKVYFIVRPEDPRAKLLKNPVYTEYKC